MTARVRAVVCGVVAMGILSWVAALAAETEAELAVDPAIKSVQDRMSTLRKEIRNLRGQIGKVEKKCKEDEEVVKAQEAMDAARKAYEETLHAKVAADPEGAELLKQQEELDKRMDALKEEWRTVIQNQGAGGTK